MIRLTLIEILFFCLPAIIFFIWRWYKKEDHIERPTPVAHLLWAGMASAIIVFVALTYFSGRKAGHEGEQYVPPRVVNGEMVPGHFVPVEPDPEDIIEDPSAVSDPQ